MDLRVFLVEDLAGTRGLIQDMLAVLGGTRVVGGASTEAEANLWLDDNSPDWDLAIIDLVLGQGSGMGVIRRCKLVSGRGRIVVFSSYVTPGIRTHCLQIGADAVFEKSESTGFIEWIRDEIQRHGGAGP
jgi:DNA-binding NarL/FixJ family response regulator